MDEASDNELLRRWREGDRGAGEVLIDRHSRRLDRFLASKVRASVHVDDLLQQVFLGLVEGQARFEGNTGVRTYLFAIARRQLFNHYREQKRNPMLDFTASSLAELDSSPSSMVARKQVHELLLVALERLPLDYQVALELAYWEGLSPGEVAQVLNIPTNTAYTRLRRARLQLRAILDELDPRAAAGDVEQVLRTAAPPAC